MNNVISPAVSGRVICGQTNCGSGTSVIREIKVTKMPNKKICLAGESFDSSGMEVTAFYTDGTSSPVTGWEISPTRALTVADRYVSVTYNDLNVKMPVKVAVKIDVSAHLMQRFENNGVWSDWEHMDFMPPSVSCGDGCQVRAVISVNKAMDLGGRSSAGIELWLKKSASSLGAKGHIKVNNVEVPLTDEYAHAYIGKIKSGDTGLLKVNIDYGDVNVDFDSNAYIVLCRDKDPATFIANKQFSLTESVVNMNLFMGKADYIFTDFDKESTLMGLNINHIFGQNDEDFGCGKNFGINLYERLETSAFPLNDNIKMPCYTDAFGYKHGFNMMFYTERIDYDKVEGTDFDMQDPSIWIKDYIKSVAEITYDEATGQYLHNEWVVQCDQVTVNNQVYLSEPPSAVYDIMSALTFDEAAKPVNWLRGDSLTKGFDKSGRLVMISDEFGNYIRIFYNGDGRITSVKNKQGKAMEFVYRNSLLSCISYGTGRKSVKYTYTTGRLTEIGYYADDSSGIERIYKTIKLEYTQIYKNGELCDAIKKIESSDKLASILEYEDGAFIDTRLIGIKNYSTTSAVPQGATENTLTGSLVLDYDVENRTVTVTDDYDNKEIYKFTNEDVLAEYYEITNGLVSVAQKNDYTAYGKNIAVSANDIVLHKYSYEDFVFEKGTETVSELTLFNMPSKETVGKIKTGDGTYKTLQTDYAYDKNNRCIKEERVEKFYNSSDVCVSTNYYTVNFFYDIRGVIKKVVTHTAYDESGTRVEEFADVEEYTYDENGNPSTVKSYRLAGNHSATEPCICDSSATSDIFYTEKTFDSNRRVSSEKDARGLFSTAYSYSLGTNLISKTTDPDGGEIFYAYNAQGNTTQIDTSINGVENKNTTEYASGEVVKHNHSGNRPIEYVYDSKRRIKNIKLNGGIYETYKYDEDISENGGRVDKTTITNAKNEKFTAVTDRHGRFSKAYYNNTLQLENSYNEKGELTKSEDYLSGATETFSYNAVGSLRNYFRAQSGNDYGEIATYDVRGRVSEVVYTGAVTRTDKFKYAVSATDKIEEISTGNFIISPKQDLQGRYTGKDVKIKGVKVDGESIVYVKEGDHLTHLPQSASYSDTSISYTYDKHGNISSITQDGSLFARYEYDGLNRLIREDNAYHGFSKFYTYDENGNIVSKEDCDYTTASHNLVTGVVTEYYYDDEYRLIGYDSLTCEYDAVNNPTTYRGKSATWTRGRKLIKFDGNTFSYDTLGQRTKKNNISFTYDSSGRLIKQSNGLEFFYDSTGLAGLKYNGVNYAYRKDVQGNIIAILDESGAVVVEYVYDAWGNHTFEGDTQIGNINPFRYRSYYYDTETYLYYLNTRYYDPEVGRFINMDGISYADPETINGLNLYAYCGNNPVMRVDADGTSFEDLMAFFERFFTGLSDLCEYLVEYGDSVYTKAAKKTNNYYSRRYFYRRQKAANLATAKIGKVFSKIAAAITVVTFSADIISSWVGNYKSGNPNWVSASVVDTYYKGIRFGISSAIIIACTMIPIPILGTALGVAASIAVDKLIVWLMETKTDALATIKDWAADVGNKITQAWNNFTSWIKGIFA